MLGPRLLRILPTILLLLALHVTTTMAGTVLAQRLQAPGCKFGRILHSPNPGPTDSALYSVVALSSKNVWAVGLYHNDRANTYQTLIEHWDGESATVVPSPNPGPLYNSLSGVAAVSPTDIWAVGTYDVSTSPIRSLIEHWNGMKWSVVPSPNPGTGVNNLLAVTAISSTNVWAVGDYINKKPFKNGTLVEHWDGKSWSVVPSPSPAKKDHADNILQGIAVVSANDIWAVGYSNDLTLIEHWNGMRWSVVASPNIGKFPNYLHAVAAVSANDVWAVGSFTAYPGDLAFTLTEHWNGTSWSVVPSPNPDPHLNFLEGVVAISTHNVWAVGYHALKGGSVIEKWDGKRWHILPSKNQPHAQNALQAISTDTPSDIWTVGFYVPRMSNLIRTLIEQYCPFQRN